MIYLFGIRFGKQKLAEHANTMLIANMTEIPPFCIRNLLYSQKKVT